MWGWYCQSLWMFTWGPWWLGSLGYITDPARADHDWIAHFWGFCGLVGSYVLSWPSIPVATTYMSQETLTSHWVPCNHCELSSLMQLTNNVSRHQFLAQMLEAKVSWLHSPGRLVSKIDNVMHFACLVKQASVDSVSDRSLFEAYILFIET